ncbi:MAG: T9SS type A sorting domain-containing protein [Crocinitomicaceae bacterium]|nr:T9SS type A sorting domain-containing protein [Crocinitomicaceae bacterium]
MNAKKTFLFAVGLLFASKVVGQQILDTNTIWSEANRKFYYIDNDTTVIGEYTYKNVHSYYGTDIHYSGAEQTYLVREEGERVFWRNAFTNEDYLLYDFGLTVGDSVYVTPDSYDTMDSTLLICENVDTVFLFGIERQRLTMRTTNPSPYYSTDIEYWLAGIGSTLGLFNSGHLNTAIVDQMDPSLYCCHKGFNQVFQTENSNFCYGSGVSLESYLVSFVQVYPNPTTGKITISSKSPISGIDLYNLYGQSITTDINLHTNELFFSEIEKGMYFLKIIINGNEIIKIISYE